MSDILTVGLTFESHLLGKKSWNVYNPENIARVKRDEARAKAQEEEDERRMQEVDAERRIKILRGERPPTPPPPPSSLTSREKPTRSDRSHTDDAGRYRKRRRLAGEDDTDRDIRLAREDVAQATAQRDALTLSSRRDDKIAQAPILDSAGHVNLFPESAHRKTEKNTEAEAEAKRQRQSYEDQYTMRFSNAEGFKRDAGRQPWYSSGSQSVAAPDAMPEKNVWGNEDPMRKERERARMDASDPLAAMKRGVRQLKATEQERKRWNDEKRKELEALKAEDFRSSQAHRRRRSKSADSLDNFRLDSPEGDRTRGTEDHRSSRRHREHRDRGREDSGPGRSREDSRRRSYHSSNHVHRRRRHEDAHDTRGSRKSESEAFAGKR